MPVSKYCCCVITKNVKGNPCFEGCEHLLDTQTFPNPDKDPTARQQCIERAAILRKMGHRYVRSVVVTEIFDPKAT